MGPNKIPVYEVIDQRPLAVTDDLDCAGGISVFRPLIGDQCDVALSRLRPSDGCDLSRSALFNEAAAERPPVEGAAPRTLRLVLGEADCTVDRGLEAVLCGMGEGERRDLCLGDGRGGRVSCRVWLTAVKKCRRVGDRAAGNGTAAADRLKLKDAVRHKDAGNRLYGEGRYADAFHRFNRSMRSVLFVRDVGAMSGERDALYAKLCNNMAACHLQRGNHEHAFQLTCKVLTVDPDNVKALVRRCRASAELKMFDGALADARHALHLEPGNSAARRYVDVAVRGIEEQNASYRDMVKKMFV